MPQDSVQRMGSGVHQRPDEEADMQMEEDARRVRARLAEEDRLEEISKQQPNHYLNDHIWNIRRT